MRLARVRITVRRIMTAVAIAAFVSLIASNPYRHNGVTDKRVVIPVASFVAAIYGIGAMRHPFVFLAPLLAAWILTPQVDHPSFDIINVSAIGCFLGWLIGVPAGWISKCFGTRQLYTKSASDRSGPDELHKKTVGNSESPGG